MHKHAPCPPEEFEIEVLFDDRERGGCVVTKQAAGEYAILLSYVQEVQSNPVADLLTPVALHLQLSTSSASCRSSAKTGSSATA